MLDTQPETDIVVRSAGPAPRGAWIAVLYAATSMLGAALLFMVQPLAAKLILPSFGGSATVWSTSSLFFQTLLLLGYVYAHVSTKRLGAFWQPRAHVLVLLTPLLFLPVALPLDAAPSGETSPTMWLLRTLTLMVGVPFLVLSTTGPLIQRWYAWSRGPRADDPYFLFAGSNLGSFIGLLSYPFLIEPTLTLTQQRWLWTVGVCVFLALMAACGLVVRAPRLPVGADAPQATTATGPAPGQVLLWLALAFLPSCLMLAVTAHISTDVAPIPMLWVLPLAAYLATFVAAFARRTRQAPTVVTRAAVVSAVLSGVLTLVSTNVPIWVVVVVDLLTVTLVSYAAHARLAATRPDTSHLTGFYLVISAGGALGGLVNGVVAPLFFNRVWEYGLTLAATPLLLLGLLPAAHGWWVRRYHPWFRHGAGAVVFILAMLGSSLALVAAAERGDVIVVAVLTATAAVVWIMTRTPVVIAVCLLLGAGAVGLQAMSSSMELQRTFYGSYRVLEDDGRHVLVHGTTVHGTQFTDDRRRSIPTGYYARSGPLGDLMASTPHDRVGVIGLGAGAIAAYGGPGQHFTFYEIDPAIRDIATTQGHFTFLRDSEAEVTVSVGDGRLELTDEPEGEFDLIVLDAFSSDAIPVHLLTREAMREYAAHLAPGGSLVAHISNRVFDLEPVLQATADDLGWRAVHGTGTGDADEDAISSSWVVITPDASLADDLGARSGWSPLESTAPVVWTDDYASVLSVLR